MERVEVSINTLGLLATQEAWVLREFEREPCVRMAEVLAVLVPELHAFDLENVLLPDTLFALCAVADAETPHLTPQLLQTLLAKLNLDWLGAMCKTSRPTFLALHTRCFSACLLARLFRGLPWIIMPDGGLPAWFPLPDEVYDHMLMLSAAARSALRTLARPARFHNRLLLALRPEGVWSAVARPGEGDLFGLADNVKLAISDALLASTAYHCTLAMFFVVTKYAAYDDSWLGFDGELIELLEGLRSYTDRSRTGVQYGLLQSISLFSEMEAFMSFSAMGAEADRFGAAIAFLREGATHDAVCDALNVLLGHAPVQLAVGLGLAVAAGLGAAAAAEAAPSHAVAAALAPAVLAASEIEPASVPSMAARAAMLASTDLGAYSAALAQAALQYPPLQCVEAPDEDDRAIREREQAHAKLYRRRAELPCTAADLLAKLAPAMIAALAKETPEACRAMAKNIDHFFEMAYNPRNALDRQPEAELGRLVLAKE